MAFARKKGLKYLAAILLLAPTMAMAHSAGPPAAHPQGSGIHADGTYADPKTWSEESFPGAIHHGDRGFFMSTFSGQAGATWYFPAKGQSNSHWIWAGEHAGTFANPKDQTEITKVGLIHKGAAGFYVSRFDGVPDPAWTFPPKGSSDSHWTWMGEHMGTSSDPKTWSEPTMIGLFHHDDVKGFFRAKFNGVAGPTWYYPKKGESNSHWAAAGTHAGDFLDPKDANEPTFVGAIHGRGTIARFLSKHDGVPGPADTYPRYEEGEYENAWWRTLATQCPATPGTRSQAPEQPTARAVSAYAQSLNIIQRQAKTSGSLALTASPLMARGGMGEYRVDSADLLDTRGDKRGSLIVVVLPKGGYEAISDVPGARGSVLGAADGSAHFVAEPVTDWTAQDTPPQQNPDASNTQASADGPDVDCEGKRIIDVLAGFSEVAVSDMGGLDHASAYALAQIETANVGLRNSHVDARLRLTAVEVIAENYAVNTENLGRMPTVFADQIKKHHADLLATFFSPASGETATAWAVVDGRYEIGKITSTTAYRHEVGHNAGGSHCNTGQDSYAFGFKHPHGTSTLGTFLCDNDLPFYSTPLEHDAEGHALGDAKTADMARVWRERANKMSSYEKAEKPVEGTIP
ncbi:hypothetical protein FHW69_003335 [Luteibacter sp. Sphag1AF]|uniref:hypothetical protein n=1 Tax=Luteibacter sp. Sphag1AF TaxID=2587031 RepID=UPI0016222CAC|nr:hypothetical protein [Luteibacter sp. Sphag1AF]MBB3228693.1 hypothetical protein [Luteibacter sp. Sphag1AF]